MNARFIVAGTMAALLAGGAHGADYTWMASPADANWNATSLNWNSGEAWADNESAPNNAIFPDTSSQKSITIPSGEKRHVKDITVNGADYTFGGSGSIGLQGTMLLKAATTLNSPIAAKKAPGLDYSTSARVNVNAGASMMNPGAGVTNVVGSMTVQSKLTVSSGVVHLGVAANATGTSAMLYICGNWNNFNSGMGYLDVAGGTLFSEQTVYVDARQFAQVSVRDGGKVIMPNVEWLNGLYNASRLTVANGGEFTIGTLRIASGYASQVNLNEGGLIAATRMTISPSGSNQAKFLFNGGRLQSRGGREDFLASASSSAGTEEQWNGSVKFAVGAGGAVFDTSNGQHIFWTRPLLSDTANDGGVRKFGSGILVFKHANNYNGPISVESGGVQLRADYALPPGTTVRLGAADAYIDGGTFDNSHPYSEQWISRVEGIGQVKYCENMHVTNSVAPSANGAISFNKPFDLRGDYEIAAAANGCSCIEVAQGQNISGLTLKVRDISAFTANAANGTYKILDAPNGYTGTFGIGNVAEPWYVKYTETAAYLAYKAGLIIVVR